MLLNVHHEMLIVSLSAVSMIAIRLIGIKIDTRADVPVPAITIAAIRIRIKMTIVAMGTTIGIQPITIP